MFTNTDLDIELTLDEYTEYTDSYIGICLACGKTRDCCEPDACGYECDSCGKPRVFGTEELLIMGKLTIAEENEYGSE